MCMCTVSHSATSFWYHCRVFRYGDTPFGLLVGFIVTHSFSYTQMQLYRWYTHTFQFTVAQALGFSPIS
jgi:hypothetical protein